jgi:hypothetical protein
VLLGKEMGYCSFIRTLSEHGNGSGSFQKKVGGVERIESGWGKSTYKVQVRIFLRFV